MSRRTAGWLWVAVQFILLAVLLLLPWQPHSAVFLSTGGFVGVIGGLLALSVSRTLGEAFTATPVPRDFSLLSTVGPYRYVRHPMYVGVLLIVLGLLIAAGTAWGWIWLVVLIGFFWLKSRWEDRLLREKFGVQWDHWAARTGAFVPRRGRRVDPPNDGTPGAQ